MNEENGITNENTSFQDWYDILEQNLADDGITIDNPAMVIEDYNQGFDVLDVAESITDEYGE